MALERVVFKQYPFDHFCPKQNNNIWSTFDQPKQQQHEYYYRDAAAQVPPREVEFEDRNHDVITVLDDPNTVGGGGGGGEHVPMPVCNNTSSSSRRRKRRRAKSPKSEEEMENQRMTHIAIERNRRRQMNDYLSLLRSLMPPSFSQRGDQASIVGGAIDYVKELEQQQLYLEARKQISNGSNSTLYSKLYTNSFTFPQYSTAPIIQHHKLFSHEPVQKMSNIADIEVNVAENHASIKILTTKGPRQQLLLLVHGLHSLSLPILHLSVTTVDHFVLYSFIVKVSDDSRLNSVNDIAGAVHELVGMIKEEANHPTFLRNTLI